MGGPTRRGSSGPSQEHGHGEHGKPLPATEGPQLLGPSALDAHRGPDSVGQPGLHLLAHRSQLGLLADHRAVGVADRPPRRPDLLLSLIHI